MYLTLCAGFAEKFVVCLGKSEKTATFSAKEEITASERKASDEGGLHA